MTYWLNVDFFANTVTIHRDDCRVNPHIYSKAKNPKNGYWEEVENFYLAKAGANNTRSNTVKYCQMCIVPMINGSLEQSR